MLIFDYLIIKNQIFMLVFPMDKIPISKSLFCICYLAFTMEY